LNTVLFNEVMGISPLEEIAAGSSDGKDLQDALLWAGLCLRARCQLQCGQYRQQITMSILFGTAPGGKPTPVQAGQEISY
jgi:hypothetical protein